ncbi:pyruvate dehydrogenase (acetyl-transferring), homodimeric type [bacterium]|nr:pyruvate dehydrogenase (acetyl-transferring), homodimeric type [bacterium]
MTEDDYNPEEEALDIADWLESFDDLLATAGPIRARRVLEELMQRSYNKGVRLPFSANTPYINTIPQNEEPAYPGNGELEWRIRSLIRWNAMAMVVRANRQHQGIGGHISSYASSATLYEVGFNHFFRKGNQGLNRDLLYIQGHVAPGIYARAFLEGRLSERDINHFRLELHKGGGLSSYPHPWLMPNFWEFPTVSMGIGPITAIYQARFMRYLEDRGLKPKDSSKVWAFLGDGETDEPEALGAITLASREKLDNLIFVVNCNLQRLDGPVRGNGKIIQELEAAFRGAGWNVIKVIWGYDWDPLLEKDETGELKRRMNEVVDGQYQKYVVESGAYIRDHFFGASENLKNMVAHLTDDEVRRLRRGGHEPGKIYAAYKQAVEHKGAPTVILAKTIKGYGLGESGEGKNITHQQKKMNEDELREFRNRFGIPVKDEDVMKAPFYKPAPDSPEMIYLKERREALGGSVPARADLAGSLKAPPNSLFEEFYAGTEDREVSTTMAFVRILAKLLKDEAVGKLVVPIVPDEARTFGMEALFRQCGIYSHVGQLYEPVDSASLLYYKEITEGQILEEGITEAGSLSSFIAAGCAYANYGVNTIPFFIFYSMFGFQRVGDFIWAAADSRAKGFLLGATAGRTTLAGEGLQHQDGHSHLLALPVPNLMAYDPAFAFELAIIIKDGIKRMYQDREDIFYYLTLGNENYPQLSMPKGVEEGILKGMYLLKPASEKKATAVLLGSGAILGETLKAQKILEDNYKIATEVWSVTSYKELYKNALDVDRHNLLNGKKEKAFITQNLEKRGQVYVSASDYVKNMALTLAKWVPGSFYVLGTDGFGRSDTREKLRDHFEVDARHIVASTVAGLFADGVVDKKLKDKVFKEMEIDGKRGNPFYR